jgi:RNA polymerase sigma factor (sigma-70 family)
MITRPDEDEISNSLESLHGESWGWALACCRGDRGAAEEALHTAYHKVLDGRAKFNGRSDFKTWLFGVIRLTSADQRRWSWRLWLRTAPVSEIDEIPSEAPGSAEQLGASDRAKTIRRALEKLPKRQAQVLRLVFYHDLTLDGAATVLGISPGSARTHYERGKHRLRFLLETER